MDGPDDFATLGLPAGLVASLTELGYEEPTPIQREAIPVVLDGHDMVGQAATGTGKTAAFALPLLAQLIADERTDAPRALVLAPTRELAMQVSEAIHRYGKGTGTRVVPVFGGQPIPRQLQALRRGADVVVATPGRAVDHLHRGTLDLSSIRLVVLDEADEMLDMGFAEDLDALLDATPATRQTLLFSATMPRATAALAERHLRDARTVRVDREPTAPGDVPKVRQTAYLVARAHKPAALGRILDVEAPEAAIVFCRTRVEVDQLTETMNARGYRAEALHGGMAQEARDRVMGRVRAGSADLLVATDVAARGLDIDHLTHVVNYDVPAAPETYVHRVGRVGRAGREGVAITLAEPREHRLLKNIERTTSRQLPVEPLPTVAELRSRRSELLVASLRESILTDDLEAHRVVVDTLSDEFDPVEIALAAVRAAAEAMAGTDDDAEDIPDARLRPERSQRGDRGDRGDHPRSKPPRRSSSTPPADATRLWIGIGRKDRLRPGDLVGAICGETSLKGRDIGAIEITDNFSLVDVPATAADDVAAALGRTTIRGRKVNVRRDRGRTGRK